MFVPRLFMLKNAATAAPNFETWASTNIPQNSSGYPKS
jgi:hypothetical protein